MFLNNECLRRERNNYVENGDGPDHRPKVSASFQVGLVESARLNGHSICRASARAAAVAMKLHFSKGYCGRAAAPQSDCLRSIEERGTMGGRNSVRHGDTAVTNHLESRNKAPLVARSIAHFKLIAQPVSRSDSHLCRRQNFTRTESPPSERTGRDEQPCFRLELHGRSRRRFVLPKLAPASVAALSLTQLPSLELQSVHNE